MEGRIHDVGLLGDNSDGLLKARDLYPCLTTEKTAIV